MCGCVTEERGSQLRIHSRLRFSLHRSPTDLCKPPLDPKLLLQDANPSGSTIMLRLVAEWVTKTRLLVWLPLCVAVRRSEIRVRPRKPPSQGPDAITLPNSLTRGGPGACNIFRIHDESQEVAWHNLINQDNLKYIMEFVVPYR